MAENGNFNKLVSGLSIEERQDLLGKLKGQSRISDEPLYYEESGTDSSGNLGMEYSRLPWYYRIWFFILSLVKSKEPEKIFEDSQVSALGNKIEERTPGLYNYQNAMLLSGFFHHVEKLKEAAHFFYSALDASVNRDRGGFFVFLGSLEMPDVHKKLQNEIDLAVFEQKYPDMQVSELRQMALKTMDDALSMVVEEYRNAMYSNARSLNCLKELSSFLFDRLLMAFSSSGNVGTETCSAGVVRELLITLNNILFSLRVVPQMTLLESLFVFLLQEKAGGPGFEINHELRILLIKAEESLTVIRNFNKQVPLTWILRCSTKNMSLLPREVSGGEDWFVVFRDCWKKRIESLFAEYIKNRRQRELIDSFRYFFKGKSLKMIENVQSESNYDGMPIKGTFAISFLYTFCSVIFIPEINLILRPILIDGEFQNKENRMEFTEGYNNLIKLEDEIKKFEFEISPAGDYGKRYNNARQEMSSLPVKRRKMQLILEEAQEDAEKILERATDAAKIMVNVLNGILGRDTSRGKYFSLVNMTWITGRDSRVITSIGETIQQFQRVLKLLEDIEIMESGR